MMPLVLHFLNVGHGDCTFIELPTGRLMMVDINNSKSLPTDDKIALAEARQMDVLEFSRSGVLKAGWSWEDYYKSLLVDPYDYYQANFAGTPIFRYLQTHPDMDHMGGLFRFFFQEKVPLLNFWDVGHAKSLGEKDFESSRHDRLDWLTYQLLRRGSTFENSKEVRDHHKVFQNERGTEGHYWTDDCIQVLSPTPALVASCNALNRYNNCSFVIKVSYGGRSVILPGDAEESAWKSILDDLGPDYLACDITKAAHHGRKSGFYKPAVEAMHPGIVVCSVGEKPDVDASGDYARIAGSVLSTRFCGSIKVTMWHDGEVWVENHKGDRQVTLQPTAAA
jgi:competence protein ComEC